MERYFNNFSTTVGVGGYTAASGVLNVVATAGVTLNSGDTCRLSIYRVIGGSNTLIVILVASVVNSSTQFAVTAEGADANALATDNVINTLTVGGMDQIRTDISLLGNYASLPSPGSSFLVEGQQYQQNDGGPYRWVFDGTAWKPFAFDFPCVQPILTGYTAVNGTAFTSNQTYGSLKMAFANNASIELGALAKSNSGFTTIDSGLRVPLYQASNQIWAGLAFRDSGTGKLVTFTWLYNGAAQALLSVDTWNSPTSFNANVAKQPMYFGPYLFLRIEDDGVSNRTYWISVNGVEWILFFSEARTTFLTANQYALVGLNFGSAVITLPIEFFHISEHN